MQNQITIHRLKGLHGRYYTDVGDDDDDGNDGDDGHNDSNNNNINIMPCVFAHKTTGVLRRKLLSNYTSI